ncbi:MAG: hypothetical protein [Circular genetic element sp.]|nr:MAG: hypothetical protein [Circular genetic element sp.]
MSQISQTKCQIGGLLLSIHWYVTLFDLHLGHIQITYNAHENQNVYSGRLVFSFLQKPKSLFSYFYSNIYTELHHVASDRIYVRNYNVLSVLYVASKAHSRHLCQEAVTNTQEV